MDPGAAQSHPGPLKKADGPVGLSIARCKASYETIPSHHLSQSQLLVVRLHFSKYFVRVLHYFFQSFDILIIADEIISTITWALGTTDDHVKAQCPSYLVLCSASVIIMINERNVYNYFYMYFDNYRLCSADI